VLVAAGLGSRFGGPKHLVELAGRPLWTWSRDALLEGGVERVVVVGDVEDGIVGGPRRQDSVAAGLAEIPEDVEYVLVHDAARPLLSADLVRRVIEGLVRSDAVVPVVPVADTLKQVRDGVVVGTLGRSNTFVVQTPQGFRTDLLRKAHATTAVEVTDDASMVEALGESVTTVPGVVGNLKITYPADLALAEALRGGGRGRVGTGLDVHRFGGSAVLRLGGVIIDDAPGLVGTSDADVVAHAVADALLGAAALGDLGHHFPSSDDRWHGADSMLILGEVVTMVEEAGFVPGNVDITIVAQDVRIAPYAEVISESLASVLSIPCGAVSVKATTTDEVGWIGSGEGIAALAVAAISQR